MTLASAAPKAVLPADDPRCLRCGYSLIGLDARRLRPDGRVPDFAEIDAGPLVRVRGMRTHEDPALRQ